MPTATESQENQTIEMSMRSKRSIGEDAVPVPSHSRKNVPEDFRQINGWGADLDPANRPMVPRELPSTVQTVRGEVRDWQQPHTKVHISNEQPNLTPTFGASIPPRLLSGMLRDYAYEFGEAANRHWMTLILADRVDMIESLILDAFRGRPDNIVRERGWTAYLKYDNARRNKLLLVGALALAAVAVGVGVSRMRGDGDADL